MTTIEAGKGGASTSPGAFDEDPHLEARSLLKTLPSALRTQVRGFGLTAIPLVQSGWFPMAIKPGQKWPPPSGLTGKSEHAMSIISSPMDWLTASGDYFTTIDPDTAKPFERYLYHNTGVRIPRNVIVLDVDDYPEEGKHGWRSLTAFAEANGLGDPSTTLPATVRLTPRGYRGKSGHRFFRLAQSQVDQLESGARRFRSEPAPNVDTLHSGHRYSMEAGSIHPDGYVYRAYDERSLKPRVALPEGLATVHPDDLPIIPQDWFEALTTDASHSPLGEASGATGAPATSTEREEAMQAFARWVDEVDNHAISLENHTPSEVLGLLTPSARNAVMELGSPTRNNSNVSAACLALLATLIEDVGSAEEAGSKPVPIRAALEVARNVYVRNGDRINRPHEFDRALAWAFPLASQSVSTRSKSQTLQWANRVVEDEFWGQTSILRSCRDFARSRLVSPDAMLACALVIVASWLPPHLTLPGLVGGEASLNMFVALGAASGGGKSTAMTAAKAWLKVIPHEDSDLETDTPFVTTIATGEGLLSAYTTTVPRPKGQSRRPGQLDFIQHRRSVRFEIDEIQTLGAAMSREASTLRSFLKQMWTGSAPSTLAADSTRTRMLQDHAFRTTVVAGVQPGSADVLLSDADGGFPQRWLWVDTFDPGKLSLDEFERQLESPPEPIEWMPPRACYPLPLPEDAEEDDSKKFLQAKRAFLSHIDGPHEVLEITDSIKIKVVTAASGGRALGDTSATEEERLDRHGVLLEEKLAALLAALHGHVGITEQFERMAEWMKAKSDQTRAAIIRERSESERMSQDARAERQGKSQAIAEVTQVETLTRSWSERVTSRLLDYGGEMTLSSLRRSINLRRYIPTSEDQIEFLESIPGVTVTDEEMVVYEAGDDGVSDLEA